MSQRKEVGVRTKSVRAITVLYGVAVAVMASSAFGGGQELPVTNTFALTMHATIAPEIHIVPPEERSVSAMAADPFSFAPGLARVDERANDNRCSFAIHARGLTMLEAIDLICFLSETPYAFDGGRLVVGSTNLPAVELKQSARRAQALIDRMKGITVPEVTFRPPATIIDAIDFFFKASADWDEKEMAFERRGVNFAVKNPAQLTYKPRAEDNLPAISSKETPSGEGPAVSALSARFCSLDEAVSDVCERVGARFLIRDNTVVICPAADAPTGREWKMP